MAFFLRVAGKKPKGKEERKKGTLIVWTGKVKASGAPRLKPVEK